MYQKSWLSNPSWCTTRKDVWQREHVYTIKQPLSVFEHELPLIPNSKSSSYTTSIGDIKVILG